MRIGLSRKLIGGMALLLMLAFWAQGKANAEELTMVGWGGALSAAEVKAFNKPFTAATGIKVQAVTYNGGLAQVKAQEEVGKVSWDVVDAEMTSAARGCDQDLLERISTSSLAPGADGSRPKADFFKDALQTCGVANYVWANVYAYNEKAFPNGGPKTIADFFNLKKFPGKRGMRKSPEANLEWALMADGVPRNKVYDVLATPKGVDRAFKVLDRIKDDVVWWEAGAQAPQLLADREVAMTTAYNGRLFNAIVKEKQPFKIVWDGQIWDYGAFVIPKNAPHRKSALAYIRFATSPKQLALLTHYISYGPARKSAMALVPNNLKSQLPTAKKNFALGLRQSSAFWTDYGDELNQRFNTWLAAN